MSRAVWLRCTAGLVFLPIAALLSADCGGNDVVDAADASRDATSDVNPIDATSDAELVDRAGDTSSDGSGTKDGSDAESGSVDAEGGSGEAGEAGDAHDGGILPPVLATAASFALLASSTITNTGITTAIVGDVGIPPPATAASLVSLPPGQVTGTIHVGDSVATQAAADLAVAYNNLVGRPCQHTMTGVDLGGKTLGPGVYCFAVAAAQAVGDLTLDGQGDPNAVWIFQIGTTLTIAASVSMNVINSGNACNVYWQVGSSATIGMDARVKGNILAKASITMVTGAAISPGRAMVETAAITMDTNSVSNLGCP